MFSYSKGYYVSPPDDLYLKFKNRCSLGHTRLRLRGWGCPCLLCEIYDAQRKRFTNIQSRNISLRGEGEKAVRCNSTATIISRAQQMQLKKNLLNCTVFAKGYC